MTIRNPELWERLDARKQELADRQDKLVDEAWEAFRAAWAGELESADKTEIESILENATRRARQYMVERVVEWPRLATFDQDGKTWRRGHFKELLPALEQPESVAEKHLPIWHLVAAQLLGALVGLSLVGAMLWPAALDQQSRLLISIFIGSTFFMLLVHSVNFHWEKLSPDPKTKQKYLIIAGLGTVLGILTLFLYRWSDLRWSRAIELLIQRIKNETSKPGAPFGRLRSGSKKTLLAFVLFVLVAVAVLILARPRTGIREDDSSVKRRFKARARAWTDYAMLLSVAFEVDSERSSAVDKTTGKELVPVEGMMEVIKAAQALRGADGIEQLRDRSRDLLNELAHCGYPVEGLDAVYYRDAQAVLEDGKTFMVWGKNLEQWFTPWGLVSDGDRVQVLLEPILKSDGTLLEAGRVRRVAP